MHISKEMEPKTTTLYGAMPEKATKRDNNVVRSLHAVSMVNIGLKDVQPSHTAFQHSKRGHKDYKTHKISATKHNKSQIQHSTNIKSGESSAIHTSQMRTLKDHKSSQSLPSRNLSTYHSFSNFQQSED